VYIRLPIDASQLTPPPDPFSGLSSSYDEAKYVVIGFPFDPTSTYRRGANKAPQAIRAASLNIETNSHRTDRYIEDLKICDLGDLPTLQNLESALTQLSSLAGEILKAGKMPVILGGEHTVTYAVAQVLEKGSGVLSFDAHFDLRDEYNELKLSHATFMRRVVERLGSKAIFHAGVRAYCKEEWQYVLSEGVSYLTASDLRKQSTSDSASTIRSFLHKHPAYHLTLDMDVLDPSHAPGVGNPEPEGITPTILLDLINNLHGEGNLVSMDLTEVNPAYDHGETAIQAAHIIFEVLCSVEAAKQGWQQSLY
jgi:agmatinase